MKQELVRQLIWSRIKQQALERDNYTCQGQECINRSKGISCLEVHRKIPRSKGGTDTLDNVVTLCQSCYKKEFQSLIWFVKSTKMGHK